MVKKGTFKYFGNTMYTIILLSLYHPALLWQSEFGLIFVLLQHILVWAHYYCTEKPDMEVLYGSR